MTSPHTTGNSRARGTTLDLEQSDGNPQMMEGLRHRAIASAFSTIGRLRADLWLAPVTRGECVVLTLHRVGTVHEAAFAPNRALQVPPAFLEDLVDETRARGFEFVSIDEALGKMRSGGPTRRRAAVLTFDDGYRDNVDLAAPILKAKGVPWALFVVPEFLAGLGCPWWLELEEAISRINELTIGSDKRCRTIRCETSAAKSHAFALMRRHLFALDSAGRRRAMDRLACRARLNRTRLVKANCLSLQELRDACAAYDITVGSHTISHAILPRCGDVEAKREIEGSKRQLESALGRQVRHLAYPHGLFDAKRDVRLTEEAGYEAAWTTRAAHTSVTAYRIARHQLPRISINGLHANKPMMRAILSGIPFVGSRPATA